MKSLVFLSSLLIFSTSLKNEESVASTGIPLAGVTASNQSVKPEQTSSTKSISDAKPTLPAGKWTYEKKVVDKAGSIVYKASIASPTPLNFSFPYAGGSVATLTIRHRNDDTFLYLEISRGQFNRTFQGGSARIAFDNQPARNYSFSAAENGRANIIFFDDAAKLITQMKKAQRMTINVEFYAQGRRTIDFSTATLSWNH
ncbi:hypothetical protein [Spirosoma linguale]|uniref:Uncharacterized protein n=1 Tax=Spirosoma linguale (strain ATCC 33905 / DSM 74 / LMG 10896 / Claus 1) TaxID=504472 RepID=D2QQX1_SPILD|nr:hypothetical protein Slin_1778 [Spirosoma linguale DSM 74]